MTTRVRQLGGLGKAFDANEPWAGLDDCSTFSCAPRLPPPPCKAGEQPVLPAPGDCCAMASCTPPAVGLGMSDYSQIPCGAGFHREGMYCKADAPAAQIPVQSGKSPLVWGAAGAALVFVLTKL